jgi:ABC-type transport system substrate-binding protein
LIAGDDRRGELRGKGLEFPGKEEKVKRGVSRKGFLKLGGGALGSAYLLSGCDLLSTEPAQEGGSDGEDGAVGKKGKEAPQLAEMVKNGELPPVEERLPEEPMVVEPLDRIGNYGGEWHLRLGGVGPGADAQQMYFWTGYENLVRWDPTFEEVVPGVAKSFEASEDGTQYTFRLREGLRWSDGEPFTADDVVFAVNDVAMNEELSSVPPFGEMEAEKIGDFTVRITFQEPNGLFLQYQSTQQGSILTNYPLHYMQQFHKEHNPDLNKLVEKAEVDDWVELFYRKGESWGTNTRKPTLNSWLLATPYGSRIEARRNPYYWKVDPQGSQLPYIDRVVYEVVDDDEIALLKVLNGEVDVGGGELRDKPVIVENMEKGDYRLSDVRLDEMNAITIHLNLTHKDPVKREVFNNKDFRIGLSHAINRQEIIDVLYQEQGEPWQAAPRPESGYFDEEFAKQYTKYDVDLANEHLDKVLPDKDGEDFRLDPDGKRISFVVEVRSDVIAWIDIMELVTRYWREVGIDASAKSVAGTFLVERAQANQHDAVVWGAEGGSDAVILLNPFNYAPVLDPYSFFGVLWAKWYNSKGEEGEEPPETIRHQLELYDEANATPDPDEQRRLMKEILAVAKEGFYVIGTNLPAQGYGTVANRLKNWPRFTIQGVWIYCSPGPTNPSQYFITKG